MRLAEAQLRAPARRELRDLTRYRVQQVRDRAQEVNRLCKVLEDAGLKLTTVVTDVRGASGRAMLRALVDGTTDPTVLAELARGTLRKKLPALRRALQGRFRRHHAFLIEPIFAKIDFLDETLDRLTAEIDGRLGPFEPMLANLDTIPGVNRATAVSSCIDWCKQPCGRTREVHAAGGSKPECEECRRGRHSGSSEGGVGARAQLSDEMIDLDTTGLAPRMRSCDVSVAAAAAQRARRGK